MSRASCTASSSPRPPLVVGLCGGIATGKSTVARSFAAHGFAWVDADLQAREVVGRPAVLAALRERFGPDVFTAAGELDRPALGALVFRDAAARADLQALTHPPIHAAIEADLDAARAAGRPALLDVPLLFENGWDTRCDEILFIDTPDEQRAARATARGWELDEWQRREAAQLPLTLKRQRATTIISNRQTIEALERRVAGLARAWLGSFSDGCAITKSPARAMDPAAGPPHP